MLFALIALVVLTLGGVALVRSVDAGLLSLGNLGFRRDALSATSAGTEQAVEWLWSRPPSVLNSDDTGNGYYATAVANLAPMETEMGANSISLVDWAGDNCGGAAVDATKRCLTPRGPIDLGKGRSVQYVVTRLCNVVGPGGSSRPCVVPLRASVALSMDRGAYGALGKIDAPTAATFYRVIARTEGVRGSVAYTETLVHF